MLHITHLMATVFLDVFAGRNFVSRDFWMIEALARLTYRAGEMAEKRSVTVPDKQVGGQGSGGRKNPPSSLAKIALEAGVSAMTVSRVLSGRPNVAAATRARIQSIARQHHYRPNLLVSGILKGTTKTVGVIASLDGLYYPRVIAGIHDELAAHSYGMLLSCDTDPVVAVEPEKQLAHIHRLVERRVDGIIMRLADDAAPETYLNEAERARVPVVLLDRPLPNKKIAFVCSADSVGARKAGLLAIAHGHRTAAYLGGPASVMASRERGNGLRRAFKERKVHPGLVEVYAENWTFPTDLAVNLLQKSPRPTVVFCVSDDAAPSIYAAAKLLGLRIPEDLSVVGFGNLPIDAVMQPALTSIEQFPREVGRVAAHLLLEALAKGKDLPAVTKRVGTDIVLRHSLGPAPSSRRRP